MLAERISEDVLERIRLETARNARVRFVGCVLKQETAALERDAAELAKRIISDTLQHIEQETPELEHDAAELAKRIISDMLQYLEQETPELESDAAELAKLFALDMVRQILVITRVATAQMLPFATAMLAQRAVAERVRVQQGVAALVEELGRVSERARLVAAETGEAPRLQAEYDLRQAFLSSARLFLPAVMFDEAPGCAGCDTPLEWDTDGGIGFVPGAGLACARCVRLGLGGGGAPEFEVAKTIRSVRKALADPGCQMPIEYPHNGKTLNEMRGAFRAGGGLFLPSAMYDEDMSCNMCLLGIDWDATPRPGFALCCPGLGFICGDCVSQPHERCGHALRAEFEIARMVGEVRNEVGI